MKRLIFILFLFIPFLVSGAARYWVGGGSSANFNATTPTNWGTASGVQDNASVPDVTSDVIFDGAGVGGNSNGTCSAGITFLSLTFTSGYTQTVTINTSVTLTIAGNFTDRPEHSWTVSGTGKITISAASTITSNGKTFPGPVTFTNTNTKTLNGNWTISGLLTNSGTIVLAQTGTDTLKCAGGITTSTAISGTLIEISGGTWSSSAGGSITNNFNINGTCTISGTVYYNTGTLKYVSGTVTTTSSTLSMAASTTLNLAGVTLNNIDVSGTATITLTSALTATGTFTAANGTVTFAGAYGWTIGTVNITRSGNGTITLANGVTYVITTAFNCYNSRTGSIMLFTSDHATLKANLTLNPGATNNVLASFTRIDASGGRPIRTFNGTLTSTTNIFEMHDIPTMTNATAE